jgi:colanic acid biosynthesis glycosyl transferase WcaI
MHIMFMAQCYAPEDVSASVLITELAVDLGKRGHKVTVITGAPNYPYGRVFENYHNHIYQVEMLDGVRVVRTWSYITPQKTFWPRILHYGTYSASAFYGGLLAGKPDVIVNYSPPLPLGITAWLLSRLWRIPWVLQIEDLYPDAAISTGVLTNRSAIAFFSKMELFLYRRADRISVISESFRRAIISKGEFAEKINLIPVWADPETVCPHPKENAFREQNGLNGKFVVMYAGNLGLTSCMEDVLDAAEILRDDDQTRFVIVGEGIKKTSLEECVSSKGLANVSFLPFQPRGEFAEMLAAADVSLVTLNTSSANTSLPSKIFNIMASARPILAVAPANSEVAHLVSGANCGIAVPPQEPRLLAEALLKLKQRPSELVKMGDNGRSELECKFSRAHCVNDYEKMLLGVYEEGKIKP